MATTVENFSNQPSTTVSSGGTTAPASGTSESWTVASSASFPAASNTASPPTQFHVADTATGKTGEIIAVTNVSGTTWTVTRGAESSTTVAHTAGFTVVQVVSAGALGGLLQSANNLSDVAAAATARTNLGLGTAAVVNTPVPIASGGTGQSAAAAAYNALSPMTTLGDIEYESGAGTAARLAGNTTATKNFLTQAGTGSVSAAPAWGTIAAGDLPAATTSAQGAVILDGTAADIQPDGVQAAGSSTKAASATHVHPYQPWQFLPESYGAKGDGKLIGDAVLNSTTTMTSASAGFTSADTGKHIMINGGNGTAAAPLITTITFVNSTTVTLGATASVTGTGFAAVYGTDDTAAINSAVSAAKTYALANSYFAEVVFGPKYYVLSAAPTQASGAGGVVNAQVPFPYPAVANTGQKLVISFRGAGDGGQAQFWLSTVPNLQGTCLVSMQAAPSTPDPTFGRQSVVGGPAGGGAFGGGFANAKAVITGISVFCPVFTNMIAWDFRYVAGLHMDACSAQAFAPANAGVHPFLSDLPASVAFQSTIGRGLAAPLITNNDDVTIPSFAAEGFEIGAWLQDHATVGRLVTVYVDAGVMIDVAESASNKSNMVTIANWSCENYNGALLSNAGSGGFFPVDITMTVETAGGSNPTYDISDANATMTGRVLWAGNGRTSNAPVVTGAAALKVVNANLGPGHWAGAPGVPGSTSAQQNTAWRDASIVLHTGVGVTVSAISIDGTSTGLTMAASSSLALPLLPAGKNVTLTYAGGTPTWDWFLA